MGEAAAGSSPLQGPEYSWKQLEAETQENVEQKAAQGKSLPSVKVETAKPRLQAQKTPKANLSQVCLGSGFH